MCTKRFGNARGVGQFTGRRVGEPFPGEQRQGCGHDGLAPFFRTQSLVNHASKLVITHLLSNRICNAPVDELTNRTSAKRLPCAGLVVYFINTHICIYEINQLGRARR